MYRYLTREGCNQKVRWGERRLKRVQTVADLDLHLHRHRFAAGSESPLVDSFYSIPVKTRLEWLHHADFVHDSVGIDRHRQLNSALDLCLGTVGKARFAVWLWARAAVARSNPQMMKSGNRRFTVAPPTSVTTMANILILSTWGPRPTHGNENSPYPKPALSVRRPAFSFSVDTQ